MGVPVADRSVVGVPSGVAASEPEEALADVAEDAEEEERRLSFSEVTEDDSEVNRFGGPGLILRRGRNNADPSILRAYLGTLIWDFNHVAPHMTCT